MALAAGVGILWAQSAVTRLGVSDDAAHRIVLSTLVNGAGGPGVGSRSFLAMSPTMRAMAVTEVVSWAKSYINSPSFKKEWADQREHSKPQPPAVKGSADDQLKQRRTPMVQQQIDQMKKAAASLPPDQRKAVEAAIAQAAAQMQASTKDPQQQAIQRQAIEGSRTNDQQRYQDDLKKWDRDFPVDPGALIARRLHEFLDLASASVNFDAKVVDRGGRKYFADPLYESKSESWKICYRAGREATGAARAAASAWLKELGR